MPEDPTPPHPTTPPRTAGTEATATPTDDTEAVGTPAAAPATATPASTSPLPVPAPAVPDIGYTAAGVPTFDGVREKIENRYGTALGATELAEDTTEVRTATQQLDARHRAAEEKLAEIRASMHKSD